MNFCVKCGARLRPGAKFCSGCGNAVQGGGIPAKPASDGNADFKQEEHEEHSDKPEEPISDETVIPKGKKKLVYCFLGCLAFVALSFLVFSDESGDLRRAAAPLGFLFFGAGAVISLYMMFVKTPGMVLNSNGFELIQMAHPPGLIRWKEVAGFRVDNIAFHRMIVVQLKNPEGFCNRHGGVSRLNMKTCGSPVAIPEENVLAMDFESLVALFRRYFTKYGSPPRR